MTIAVFSIQTYYCGLMSLILYYLIMSFQSTLPWTTCRPEWGEECFNSSSPSSSGVNSSKSSSELYFLWDIFVKTSYVSVEFILKTNNFMEFYQQSRRQWKRNRKWSWYSFMAVGIMSSLQLGRYLFSSFQRGENCWKSFIFLSYFPLYYDAGAIRKVCDLRRCHWWNYLFSTPRLEQNDRSTSLVCCRYTIIFFTWCLFWRSCNVCFVQQIWSQCNEVKNII